MCVELFIKQHYVLLTDGNIFLAQICLGALCTAHCSGAQQARYQGQQQNNTVREPGWRFCVEKGRDNDGKVRNLRCLSSKLCRGELWLTHNIIVVYSACGCISPVLYFPVCSVAPNLFQKIISILGQCTVDKFI